jgi:predicted RNA-binding Zn-ribbon protein involved in translation (DUF1610 family)
MEPFACPRCQVILILPDHYAGTSFPCPNCMNDIQVPGSAERKPHSEEPEGDGDAPAGSRNQRCPGNLRTVLPAATSSSDSWWA